MIVKPPGVRLMYPVILVPLTLTLMPHTTKYHAFFFLVLKADPWLLPPFCVRVTCEPPLYVQWPAMFS